MTGELAPQSFDATPPDPIALEVLALDGLCTFNWNGLDGWPMGVTVKFLWLDDRLHFVFLATAPRLKALKLDDRVSVVIPAETKTVTAKGRCLWVEDDDRQWEVFRALGAKTAASAGGSAEDFAKRLCQTNVAMEVVVHKWISFDLAKKW